MARNISHGGALLSGVDQHVKCGDLIGVLYQGKKARYGVVWTRVSDAQRKPQVAVQKLAKETCPWRELLPRPSLDLKSEDSPRPDTAAQNETGDREASACTNARRWQRHTLDVPIRVIVHDDSKNRLCDGRGNELSETAWP